MAVAETGTIAVKQFDVCRWSGKHQRLLGGVFGAVKGVILVTLAVMVFSHTDLPKTEEWQSSHTIPYFESLADAAMPYLPGKIPQYRIFRVKQLK